MTDQEEKKVPRLNVEIPASTNAKLHQLAENAPLGKDSMKHTVAVSLVAGMTLIEMVRSGALTDMDPGELKMNLLEALTKLV